MPDPPSPDSRPLIMSSMPEVVIVGAGVMGASVAWHLASRGCRDVVVLDRGDAPGSGSTGRATGGFRCQFSTEVNIRLSMRSREKLRDFPHEVGSDPGYQPDGYLFLARSEEALRDLRSANELQQRCGLSEATLLSAQSARDRNPAVEDDGIVGGAFCPTDGFLRPMQILTGYTDAAKRLGVRFETGVEVAGVERDGERVRGVRSSRGSVGGDVFVNAAGAWASTFGIDIPVVPLRRQVAVTVRCDLLPVSMPMTIWIDDGFHFRVRDERVLLLWPDAAAPGFLTEVEDRWLDSIGRFVAERVPILANVPLDRAQCWAGLYEMSPDRHALVGRVSAGSNLYLINGSSGHGVMHAPALGEALAEMILDGAAHSIDLSSLRPSRFAEGAAIRSSELL